VETGGFPNTSADPAHGLPWWLVLAAALLAALAIAGAVRLRSALGRRWS
jgi:hypothetical protein